MVEVRYRASREHVFERRFGWNAHYLHRMRRGFGLCLSEYDAAVVLATTVCRIERTARTRPRQSARQGEDQRMIRAGAQQRKCATGHGQLRVVGTLRPRLVPTLLLLSVTSLSACSLARPERVVGPDIVGVIDSVDRSDASQLMVQLAGGDVVEVDAREALELAGPGINPGRLLVYGQANGGTWYATLPLSQTARPSGCYAIGADGAFDEPASVVLVFADHPDFGIRVSKRNDFVPPPNSVRADGRYAGGVEGTGGGAFCTDPNGASRSTVNPRRSALVRSGSSLTTDKVPVKSADPSDRSKSGAWPIENIGEDPVDLRRMAGSGGQAVPSFVPSSHSGPTGAGQSPP
jgi:hypothetical protein